jgi:hypothetical protein
MLATLLTMRRAHVAWTFVFALLAMGAKETGFLVAPLAAAWTVLVARDPGRARRALASAWPVALAAAVVLAARTAVLGGLGGHTESGAAALARAGGVVSEMQRLVVGSDSALAAWLLLVCAALGVARAWRTDGKCLAWLACWTLATLLLILLSGRAHAWYAQGLVVPVALFVAVVVQRAVGNVVEQGRAHGGSVMPDALAGMGMLVACGIFAAAGLDPRRTVDFEHASARARATRGALEEAVQSAEPGGRFVLREWTLGVPRAVRAQRAASALVFVHAPYSLAALVECLAPATSYDLALVGPDGAAPPLDPARWQVLLLPPIEPARVEGL